jgi:hypothetical protein
MKIDIDPEDPDRGVRALEHYNAYLRSQQREDSAYPWLVEQFKKAR